MKKKDCHIRKSKTEEEKKRTEKKERNVKREKELASFQEREIEVLVVKVTRGSDGGLGSVASRVTKVDSSEKFPGPMPLIARTLK